MNGARDVDPAGARLPRAVGAVLRRALPRADANVILGDLAEEAHRRSALRRPLWLARQTASLVLWSIIDRLDTARSTSPAGGLPRGRHAGAPPPHHPRPSSSPRSRFMSQTLFEMRCALRGLRRSPGFALAMIATVAIGVGGTITVFALVHGVLLAPLEYREPGRLVAIWPSRTVWASKALFRDIEGRLDALQGIAAWSGGARVLGGDDGEPELVLGPEVSAGFLEILGYRPALGRFLRPADNDPGAAPVVVLTHELLTSRFGGDERLVGETIRLDGQSWTVIGVLPPGAQLLQPDAQMVTPLRIDPATTEYRTATYLRLVGRLREGIGLETASAEMHLLATTLQQEYSFSDAQVATAEVVSLQEFLVGDRRPLLTLLMGAVLLVLLAACVNAGNLTMARQLARRPEVAVRAALGSGRLRSLTFLASESLLLTVAGGLAGTLLAAWTLAIVRATRPLGIPRVDTVHLSPAVLAITCAATAAAALTAGLLPALRASRTPPADALRGGRSGSGSRATRRAREALVVVEVALAVMLAVAAGLMGRSLWDLTRVDPGFEPDGRLVFQLVPPAQGVGAQLDVADYYERMVVALEELPETVAAAAVNAPPVRGDGWVMGTEIEGVEYAGQAEHASTYWRVISPTYFDALGARVRHGRALQQGDTAGTAPVAVVNETFARTHWPEQDAIGKRFRIGWDTGEWLTVVGVVGDIRHVGMRREPPPTVYRPLPQAAPALARVGATGLALVVHTRGAPLDTLPAVRTAIRAVDPAAPIVDPAPLDSVVRASLAEPRLLLQVLMVFGGAALLLSAVGIAGIVAQLVRERRREFGIRQALGARSDQIVARSLARGVLLGGLGLALGSLGALAVGPLLGSFLFQVQPRDPLTLATVLTVLGACILAASWVPSRRAARIDPSEVLRL